MHFSKLLATCVVLLVVLAIFGISSIPMWPLWRIALCQIWIKHEIRVLKRRNERLSRANDRVRRWLIEP